MHGSVFTIAIIAICMAAWVINNWIRARHGYPISDDWGRSVKTERSSAAELMAAENEQLKGMIVRLEERLATLERIATDEPTRLSAEIERLR